MMEMKNGWVIFDIPTETPPLTNETLTEWESADDEEEYRRAFFPQR